MGSPYLEQSCLTFKKHNKSAEIKPKQHRSFPYDQEQEQEPGTIRVEVLFKGQRFTVVVHGEQSGEIVAAVKRELILRARSTKENLPEFLRIVGFESIGG
ncbi:MAG: hypothetical protein JST59_02735 [Actinobacteria bacterium]|nr:hypothetical protein [Actinomycetota bacterium]